MHVREGSGERMTRSERLSVAGNFRHSPWEWNLACDQRDEEDRGQGLAGWEGSTGQDGVGTGWGLGAEGARPALGQLGAASCQGELGAAAGDHAGTKAFIQIVATTPPCPPSCPVSGSASSGGARGSW